MSFNLNEMVQTLSYVAGTMAIFKDIGQSSVDYSAITPSIIGNLPTNSASSSSCASSPAIHSDRRYSRFESRRFSKDNQP